MNISDEAPDDRDAPSGGPGFPRWLKWGLLGALALVVVGYGALYLDANVTHVFLGGGEDAFTTEDLDARLAGDETVDGGTLTADETTPVAEPTRPTEPTPPTNSSGAPPADPIVSTIEAEPSSSSTADAWTATDESEVGYRVKEILFGVDAEGVGRTNQVTGSLTINGAQVSQAEFVVDVASISSDESRRDSQFRGRIMSTDEFPTATFTLTEPIELGTESEEGATVETTASGDLTLRGVTNPVTFDVSAKQENGRIGVLGTIPVVFADYGIANPSVSGITTEDNGQLEFVLVFEPA
ncbi:MAG: YceI family protein [Ilumatobacter sp.]